MKRIVYLLSFVVVACDSSDLISPNVGNENVSKPLTVIPIVKPDSFNLLPRQGLSTYLGIEGDPGNFKLCVTGGEDYRNQSSILKYSFHFIQSNSDLDKTTDSSFSASLVAGAASSGAGAVTGALGGSVGGSRKSLSEIRITDKRVWGLLKAEKLFSTTQLQNEKLRTDFAVGDFLRFCGDSYIAGEQRGAKVEVLFSCSYQTDMEKQSLTSTFKASAQSPVMGGALDMQNTITTALSQSHDQCDFYVEASGVPNLVPEFSRESPEKLTEGIVKYIAAADENNANVVRILHRKYSDLNMDEKEKAYWNSTGWKSFLSMLDSMKVILENNSQKIETEAFLAQYKPESQVELTKLVDKFVLDSKVFVSCAKDPSNNTACGRNIILNPGDTDPW